MVLHVQHEDEHGPALVVLVCRTSGPGGAPVLQAPKLCRCPTHEPTLLRPWASSHPQSSS